jgi:hypothetical protein
VRGGDQKREVASAEERTRPVLESPALHRPRNRLDRRPTSTKKKPGRRKRAKSAHNLWRAAIDWYRIAQSAPPKRLVDRPGKRSDSVLHYPSFSRLPGRTFLINFSFDAGWATH